MTQAQLSVTVLPRYLEEHSQPAQNEYAWSYTVTIVNTGTVSAQVVGRHWVITDATGLVEEVRGLALVGHQPLIPPGEKFGYTSWTFGNASSSFARNCRRCAYWLPNCWARSAHGTSVDFRR